MKHFLLFTFLFLAIFVNAQNVEDIFYVPSSSGNYTNLIVKGNANINNLNSGTFDIHSYGSLLTIRLAKAASKINIDHLSITASTGTATFVAPTYGLSNTPNVYIKAGYLSYYRSVDTGNVALNIASVSLPQINGKDIAMDFNAHNVNATSYDKVYVNNLEIFGMTVPDTCPNNYYWQPVKVIENNTSYDFEILACNTTNCTNPKKEEECLEKNSQYWHWDSNLCQCIWLPF